MSPRRAFLRSPVASLAVGALPVALIAACSATSTRNTSTSSGGAGTTSVATGGSGGTATTTGTGGGGFFFEGGVPEGGGCAAQCSSDFHSVIDCNGTVIQQCTGADGCDSSTGTCDNACQAAVNNKQSVGCEYYATDMDQNEEDLCFAAYVANTWNTPVHIAVDFAGMTLPVQSFAFIPSGTGTSITYGAYDATAGLMPGQVAVLFLAGSTGTGGAGVPCPQNTAMPTTSAQIFQATGLGNSFHITTDVPVVSYEINPYGGGSAAVTGASLLLPVSAWDKNYVAVTVAPYDIEPPSMNIIASVDDTHVTMLPSVAVIGGGGLSVGAPNTPYTFTLMKGQMAQFTQQGDLTGSVLQADQPIGFMAGQPCMHAPKGVTFCDHGEQMVPPVRALGSEYAAVMHRPRVTGDEAIWHLVGAVDGTTLTYSTAVMGPATLDAGQVVDFITDVPFVVQSQDSMHPFMLFEYMSGSHWAQLNPPSTVEGYGDPDFVISVPPAQYMSDYVFFTDPTYPETNLVVVRHPNKQMTFDDVKLDCAGALTGWQPVGPYEYTRIDLSRHDFVGQNGCNNGLHEISSTSPFGLWVWGWGTPETTSFTANVSYGYPGGMNVQPINSVIIPPTAK